VACLRGGPPAWTRWKRFATTARLMTRQAGFGELPSALGTLLNVLRHGLGFEFEPDQLKGSNRGRGGPLNLAAVRPGQDNNNGGIGGVVGRGARFARGAADG